MDKKFLWVLVALLIGIALNGCSSRPLACVIAGDGRQVCYEQKDGVALAEGDIALDLPRARQGFAIPWTWALWTDGVVPYEIDAALPKPERVMAAIEHYHDWTNL